MYSCNISSCQKLGRRVFAGTYIDPHSHSKKMPHLATSTLPHPWRAWGAEANMYTIREVDANDKANFILSPNLFEVAKSKGWSLGSAGVTMVVG